MKILFIRMHEACNANCWFCQFAKSRDTFRLSLEKFDEILAVCQREQVGYIRFTGGEPLLDANLPTMIRMAKAKGIKTSVITNGAILKTKASILSESGLDQIIVSIDAVGEAHDQNRGIKGLYNRAMSGLEACKQLGIKLRVNTVCGPHNIRNIPQLQRDLTQIGVCPIGSYQHLSKIPL